MVIGYSNVVDLGTITVSSGVGELGGQRLQDPHVAHKWRTAGNSANVRVDFGAQYAIGAVALIGTNLTASATRRIRLSTSDPLGQSSLAFDTGTENAGVDPRYGLSVYTRSSDATGRYLRVDLEDATLPFLEVGRLAALTLWRLTGSNYEYGWTLGYADPSRAAESGGGQTWIDKRPKRRVASFTIPALTEAERNTHALEVQRLHGISEDILVVRDPEAANLGRESVWGLISDLVPLEQPSFRRFSMRLAVSERR